MAVRHSLCISAVFDAHDFAYKHAAAMRASFSTYYQSESRTRWWRQQRRQWPDAAGDIKPALTRAASGDEARAAGQWAGEE